MRQTNGLHIILQSCGLGPLRVKKIEIIYGGVVYNSFKELFPPTPANINVTWEYWHIFEGDESILSKDQSYSLVKLTSPDQDNSVISYYKDLYKILYKTKVIIHYSDIYDRQMPIISVDYSKAANF